MTGVDWTERYPWIVDGVKAIKVDTAIIDAEAVIADEHGVTQFDKLGERIHDASAFAYAFDVMIIDDQDVRQLPIEERKARLVRCAASAKHPASVCRNILRATARRSLTMFAGWGLKASCRNVSARATNPDAAPLGLRPRTRKRLRCSGSSRAGGDLYLGKIKIWNDDRGFGFIRRDDGKQPDVFVHISALTEGIDSLPREARVSFDITEDARTGKTRAVNVKVIA